MQSIKHIALFTKNNFIQLGRKWFTLPLLLLFPIILIGIITIMFISIMDISETETIKVGLVDFDQSEETEIIVELLEESSQLGDVIAMSRMTEDEAVSGIEENQLSAYITFPAHFIQKLMDGDSSQLSIIGNPKRPLESQLVNELVETITRHIRGSQANILTINYYAKQLDMDNAERNDFLFKQFTDYFFYVLGSDKVLEEDKLINNATASPVVYFSLAGWFAIVTIWLYIFYIILYRDSSENLKQRMQLYGVTDLQQAISVGLVTLILTAVFAIISFLGIQSFIPGFEIAEENYLRIGLLMILHSIIFIICLILLNWLIRSQKLTLLIQTAFTGTIILLSGAIIPRIYFPVYAENFSNSIFSHQAFYWIEQVALNGRFYAEYQPLTITLIIGLILLAGVSFWKERVH
ncbi:ABC-2 type transport system permease protein [Gracilibacillus ureilyticus]|uniref:ABC-2 type transport system permease protein n=1 Tax=Gracilibacillus ureilyticus TaxID=531814 RepID=A0A1H9MU39_9BACI|nr:ABC transporter permease [Gracilibacillus ureilyticus]SER27240.1 ABC-2 type transport system permease protein [Gracilibacillus ureilyticus]